MKDERNPYLKRVGKRLEVSARGLKFLDELVTDVKGQVYAFHGKASPLMVAAAMARLSRRGSDLREIYLDEFAMTGADDASGLIHRVVTAYGDDSVQQLVGLHFVVEDASNYLTKQLEWGRFAAYLEQSTRYIYYDQKDSEGRYKYYTPANLNAKTKREYEKTLNQIFDLYSDMVHKLTTYVQDKTGGEPKDPREAMAWRGATRAQACDAIRPVLPTATKSTVGIFASAQAVESLIMNLLAEDLEESRVVGQQLLREARKVIPAFLERADKPDRGGATTAYWANTREAMSKLAKRHTPKAMPKTGEQVDLLSYWPKREQDIVADLLFSESDLSTKELNKAMAKLSARQKRTILEAYLGQRLNRRHKPGRAMEIPHYTFEIVADYGTFRDLQRHRVVDAWEWQRLTPAYGYEIPELVKEAGLTEPFIKCFELAEVLYANMVKACYTNEAQYATLFGHRLRYKFMLNARAAFHFIELRSSPQGHPGYRRVVNKMHDRIKAVHPWIASAMQFANKDEDPALTRMAAELATQYKLEKLDKLSKKK